MTFARNNDRPDVFSDIVGDSPALRHSIGLARRLAHTSSTVLLTGETGVGKELFAKALHTLREKADSPFVAVNCGALMASLAESEMFGYEKGAFSGADPRGKPGKIELARGGTLFLDEIGELSADSQAMLLRVLEDREYFAVGGTRPITADCRFIAATNRDLASQVEAGRFREDLYYRLSVIALDIPPLRERTEDIPLLAETFLRRFGNEETISPEMTDILMRYYWPGNVRELRNAIERLHVLSSGGGLQPEHLPAALLRAPGLRELPNASSSETRMPLPREGTLTEWLADCERRFIEAALEETKDNKLAAAQRLGISRMTLYNKLGIRASRGTRH